MRKRVGDAGLLTPDQYEVTFIPRFREIGLTRESIRRSANRAFKCDHLHSADDSLLRSQAYSVLVGPSDFGPSAAVLMVAFRIGARLQVANAWIVFAHEVQVLEGDSALEVCRQFARRYGIKIGFGDKTDYLIVRDFFPGVSETAIRNRMTQPRGVANHVIASASWLGTARGLEVAMWYEVNVDKYVAELAKQGIAFTIPDI